MGAYLVRGRKSKGMLGLFVAETMAGLWDAVDEHADPHDYEFREVRFGSMMFKDADEPVFTIKEDINWEPAAPSYELWQQLKERTGWRRFDHANRGVGLIARVFRAVGRADEVPD